MRLVWALSSLAFLILTGCASDSVPQASPATTTVGQDGAHHYDTAPVMMIDVTKTYAATITTAKGIIQLSLNAKAAPITVNNFVFLATYKFYDGLVFHRVVADFVIQGGDPNGDGSGGPGYTIPDEASGLLHDVGALAMAKTSEPNSAGSQFYITLAAQPSLDGNYTVFGQVTAGMDVVGKIVVGDKIQSITITAQ